MVTRTELYDALYPPEDDEPVGARQDKFVKAAALGELPQYFSAPDDYLPDTSAIVQEIEANLKSLDLETAEDIAALNDSSEQKLAQIVEISKSRRERKVSGKDAAWFKIMENEPLTDTQVEKLAEADAIVADPQLPFSVDDEFASLIYQYAGTESTLRNLADVTTEVFIGTTSIQAGRVAQDLVKKYNIEVEGTPTYGNQINAVRKWLRTQLENTDIETGKALVHDVFKTMVDKQTEFGLRESGIELMLIYQTLFGQDGDLEPSKLDRWLTDITAAAELLGPISIPLKGLRAFKNLIVGSNMDKLAAAAPSTAKKVAQAAVKSDNPDVEQALGATKDQILSEFKTPKIEGEPIKAGPDLNDVAILTTNRTGSELLPHQVTDFIREGFRKNAFDFVNSQKGAVHLSKTAMKIKTEEDFAEFTAVFGKTDEAGYEKLEEALSIADNMKQRNPHMKITILSRDDLGKRALKPIDMDDIDLANPTVKDFIRKQKPGEFYIQVHEKRPYSYVDFRSLRDQYAGEIKSTLERVFSRFLPNRFNVEHAIWRNGIEIIGGEANTEMKKLLEPVKALSKKELDELGAYLYLTPDSTKAKLYKLGKEAFKKETGLNDKQWDALVAHRRRADISFALRNAGAHLQLNAAGYKTLEVPLKGKKTERVIARPLDRSKTKFDPKRGILDAHTGEVTKSLSAEDRKLLRAGRATLWQVWDQNRAVYAITRSSKPVKPLQTNVLEWKADFFPRYLDATHYVVRITNNGEDAVKATLGEKDALDFIAKHGKPGEQLVVREARELHGNFQDITDPDSHAARLFTKANRNNTPITVYGDLEQKIDTWDALQKMAAESIREGVISRELVAFSRDWEKTYGLRFKFGSNWDYEEFAKAYRKAHGLAPTAKVSRELFNEAQTLASQINHLAGTTPSWVRAVANDASYEFGNKLIKAGDSLGIKMFKHIGGKLGTSRDGFGIIRSLRWLAFKDFIAWRPNRQMVIQPSDILFFVVQPGAVKYIFKGPFLRDAASTVSAKLGEGTARGRLNLKQLEKSGVTGLIDENQVLLHSQEDIGNLVNRGAAGFGGVLRGLDETLTKYGFFGAEYFNKINAFLIARNKYIKETGKRIEDLTDAELKQIGAVAETMTLSMNASGRLGTQDGALGALFQFTSHMLKATALVLPRVERAGFIGKLGSDALTNGQKGAILAASWALFGPGGEGEITKKMTQMVMEETGLEPDNEFRVALENGIINTILHLVNPNAKIDLDPLSPIGGWIDIVASPAVILAGLWQSATKQDADYVIEAFSNIAPAPAFGLIEDIGDAVRSVHALFSGDTANLFNTKQQIFGTFTTITRIAPMLTDIERAFAVHRFGLNVTKNGVVINELGEAATIQALAALAGLSPKENDNFYQLMKEFRSNSKYTPGNSPMNEIEELAKAHADAVIGVFGKMMAKQVGFGDAYDELVTRLHLSRPSDIDDPGKLILYKNALFRELRKRFDSSTTLEAEFVDSIISAYMKGKFLNDESTLRRQIASFPQSEARDKLIETLDRLSGKYPIEEEDQGIYFTEED